MSDPRPFWVDGEPQHAATSFDVRSPWDGRLVGTVAQAQPEHVERAVTGATRAAGPLAALPAHARAAALTHVSAGILARAEELAELITAENGKPIMWA